jgi:hypothetical protein
VWGNRAHDWNESGATLGFQGAELLAKFRPQWHHIYPKKVLKDRVDETAIDAPANIAVIGPEINIRISAKDPMKYLEKYKIGDDKLREQFIGCARGELSIERFNGFIADRASKLAAAANAMLLNLSRDLPNEYRPLDSSKAAVLQTAT